VLVIFGFVRPVIYDVGSFLLGLFVLPDLMPFFLIDAIVLYKLVFCIGSLLKNLLRGGVSDRQKRLWLRMMMMMMMKMTRMMMKRSVSC
jgi:uncharacterized membrane protein YbjE (DUF340 family)